jgi:hypothetical protein
LTAVLIARLGVSAEAAQAPTRGAEAEAFFESRIRPLLADRCWGCHGPEKQKGDVRLDSRPALVADGDTGPLVVPRAPAESRLIEVVDYGGPVKMPPKGKLPETSIADLRRWIELGAPWPESPPPAKLRSGNDATPEARRSHWAIRPVGRPEMPSIRDKSWPSTPIDVFILAQLEHHGLTPSPPADRRTLIRRVTVDLLGLPPTPEEVDAFIGAPEPDDLAYARLVERLLASPHYGERWGRHWLDVARYADSKGYVYADREEERYPFSYTYRDYVIRAFNQDLPFDRFLLEQIAGDCLPCGPGGDRSRLAALGFLTLGRRFVNNIHDIIDDRLDVIFRGTQGLTIGCARCHDHKYDPIPTRDYYSLYGVLAGATERTVRLVEAPPDDPARRLYECELDARQKALDRALEARRAELSRRLRDRVEEYLAAVPEADKLPGDEFYVIIRDPNDLNPVFVHRWKSYLLRTQAGGEFHPIFGPWHAFAALGEKEFASKAPALAARFARDAAPDGSQQLNRKVVSALLGPPPTSMREVARRYAGLLLEVHKSWLDSVDRARQSGRPQPTALSDPDAEALRQVLYAPDSPTSIPPLRISEIEPFFDEKTRVELAQLQMKIDQWNLEATVAPPQALVLCEAANPVNPRVFRRGNPTMMGEAVPRQFLAILSTPGPRPFAHGSGRLELARAIASPDNPLTARVLVNRVWMHHFGAGLVRTPSDFGARGEPPSHPELLDDLARRFVEGGWSIKGLHRIILMSRAYRQRSEERAAACAHDPENRQLWRMNPRRLDWESLRDATLAVAGRLDTAMGCRPVQLIRPPYSTRRTVYGFIDRQNFPGLFRNFDAANPDQHTPQRHTTTIPQQSLFLMNHPFMAEAARALAERSRSSLGAAAEPRARIRRLFMLAYQRPPEGREEDAILQFVSSPGERLPSERVASPPAPAWRYGTGTLDRSSRRVVGFREFGCWTGEQWQPGSCYPDARSGLLRLTRTGGQPGLVPAQAAVRRWVAPSAGTVEISGTLRHGDADGDGVEGAIVASRQGDILGTWGVRHGEAKTELKSVYVRPGDVIDFVVEGRSDPRADGFAWAPRITLSTGTAVTAASTASGGTTHRSDAAEDFAGPPVPPPQPLSAWDELGLTLLLSNEFVFID